MFWHGKLMIKVFKFRFSSPIKSRYQQKKFMNEKTSVCQKYSQFDLMQFIKNEN